MNQEPELSILLIEDEPDAAMLIQHVLARGGGAPIRAEWARDLRTGLQWLGQREFHAVLLDLNLPDSAGYETFACVRQQFPDRAVIVLTGHEDQELALQAVRGGADEYLIKSEIRDRFLAQRIRYAIERNRLKSRDSDKSVKNGKILSFIGAKGGAGTTTLVVNLAAALAKHGKSVIAIELMPESSSFAIMLNHASSWDISTLLRSAPEMMTRDAVSSCLEDFGGGFRAVFGPQQATDYSPISPEHARALLGIVRKLADYTLIDVPSLFAPSTAEVLQQSSFTTLVVERNRMGLEAAVARMPVLQALVGRPGGVGAILINKTPFTEFLTPAEFGRRLSCGVIGVVPPAADAYNARESDEVSVLYSPDTPFAQTIQDLTRRLTSGTVRYLAA